jgi:RNA polymerase sigma-70 factor (ECF subfamily)
MRRCPTEGEDLYPAGWQHARTAAMDVTRQSLLIRAQTGDEGAWQDLCDLYRPLIVGWLRRQSVPSGDLDDLVQEVFLAVVRGLPSFSHSGRQGAFRAWLRTIAFNYSCDYWKSPANRAAVGDLAATEAIRLLEDPDSRLNKDRDAEHDRYVLRCLLEMMELEFETTTVTAFRRLALEGASGMDAAAELGISVGAVYAARSRVLRRPREVAEGLIDPLI